MRWLCMTMLSGGAGLWVGSQDQVAEWLQWVLLSLGTATWIVAKLAEWREAKMGRNRVERSEL